jgi:uncharacterized protein (DUF2147 family)
MALKIILVIVLSAFSSISLSAQDFSEKILGDWKGPRKQSILTIAYGDIKKGQDPEKFYGALTWLTDPNKEDGTPKLDDNNPDEGLKNTPLLGLTILTHLEWKGDQEEWIWKEGRIYDPESGYTYSFQAEIDPENPDVLMGRGFLGFSLLGRTAEWTRMK